MDNFKNVSALLISKKSTKIGATQLEICQTSHINLSLYIIVNCYFVNVFQCTGFRFVSYSKHCWNNFFCKKKYKEMPQNIRVWVWVMLIIKWCILIRRTWEI